jgi:hypothetical protein
MKSERAEDDDYRMTTSKVRTSTKSPKAAKRSTQRVLGTPQVGIFWLLGNRLLIESTPVNQAEDYSEFKIHPGGHDEVWEMFQRDGIAPVDLEYDEVPRGRVAYNVRTKQFLLLADGCILKQTLLVDQIKARMNLPPDNTKVGKDDHYRCPSCLPGS